MILIGGENEQCTRFWTKLSNRAVKKKTVLDTIVTNKVKRRNSGLDKKENHRHAMHARVIFLAAWVEVGHCVTDVFIFVKEKEP